MPASANLLVLASLLLGLPTVFAQTTWTGGASSDAWCDAANWDAGVPTASTDAFVRGGASVYPEIDGTESCTVEARTLDINDDNSGGWLTITDGTLDVLTLLYTKNTGGNTGLRLEGGQATAAGMDLHGDHSGRFTGGELVFDGSNTATRFLGTFRPNGTLVRFAGTAGLAPTVFFASPGTGPGQSFFEHVVVEGRGLVVKSGLGGNNGTAWVTETLTLTDGALTGGNIYYATTLPVISGGTYNVGSTHFHGTRTLGSGQSYLLPFGNLYVNKDGTAGGQIIVTGGTLDLAGILYTYADNNGGIALTAGQIAAAGMELYGDHSGRFTGGELVFDGNNAATRFLGTFRPNGTLVRFAGTAGLAPTVFFASPGTGPGQSFFEHVVVEGRGLVVKSGLGGNNGTAWVTETLTLTDGALTGGNIYYATTLPVISGGTYNVGSTHFHGTRTLGSGQSYLLPFGNLYVNKDGTAGGQIIVTGGTLDLAGILYTYADNNGGIALTAGQIAAAGMELYGDHSGRFTGGELVFDGNNAATRFLGTFRPNGTLVRFAGTAGLAPTVFFASPGTGPGQSFFEHVVVEGRGLVVKSGLGGNNGTAWVTETLTLTDGALTGGNIYYATTLPVISGGTYNVGSTHFHGTRTLGSGQSYLLPFGNLYVNKDGTAGGQIIVTGGTLDLAGILYTYADNNGGIALTAGQIAAAGMELYGDHSGRFTGGELVFDGNNAATRFLGTFRPNGTLVRFAGTAGLAPTVFFASPGTGPGQSFFEHVVVEGRGLVVKSGLGGNNGTAWVTETLTLTDGALTGGTIFGKPRLVSPASVGADPILNLAPFTVSGLNVNGLEVQSSGRLIFEGGGCIRLDNTTFSVFSATEPRLTIRHPGGNLELNNLSFETNPNNIHLAAEDTSPGNPYRLNLHVVNPTPSTATEGTNYTEAGGSEVLWDGPALAPLPVTLLLEAADAPPIVVPDSGGALTYRATLTNTSPEPQTFEARIVAVLPNGSVFGPIQGPRTVRVPANQTIGPVSFTDNVPAIAPAGTYSVVLEGTTLCPEATPTPGGFQFEKEPSDSTGARTPSLALLLEAWTGGENTAWEAGPSEEARDKADEMEGVVPASSEAALPEAFMLHAAYPNPSRGSTTLRLDVPEASPVRVEVYDRLGRRVAVIHDGSLPAGEHALRFNASTLTAGLYIVRATDGTTTLTQHLTLLR